MPGTTPSLYGQLQRWFEYWRPRDPGQDQDTLVVSLMQPEHGELVDQLKCTELLEWVRTWHKRLLASFILELPRESVLCAFSCVEDTIYRLDQAEFDEFLRWLVAQDPDIVAQAVARAASGINSAGEHVRSACHDWADVLAALLFGWQAHGERPLLLDAALRAEMAEYVAARQATQPDRVIRLLGGAAGNMSSVLGKLDLSVAVHWPYHSPDVARQCPSQVDRLTIVDGRPRLDNASRSGAPDHPLRRSIIFSYGPGITFDSGLPGHAPFASNKHDRQIYRYPFYSRTQPRGWSEMYVVDEHGKKVPIRDPGHTILQGEGWPLLPLFGSWKVQSNRYEFQVAGDECLQEVARRFDYVLLSGIHAINDPLLSQRNSRGKYVNQKARKLIKRTLKCQLKLLAAAGCKLHLEVSGFTNPQIADWARAVMRGAVRSAGINQEELETITGGKDFLATGYFHGEQVPEEDMYARYARALHLARTLDLDRLHVHATDADLILLRGATRGAIYQQLVGSLFSKGAVVVALLERSFTDWERTASEMKILLRREAFLALLQLATGIARRECPHPKLERQRLLKDILFSGYWYNRRPDDYSVLAVPVMWPKPPDDLSTTGAGDIVSACFAVLGRM